MKRSTSLSDMIRPFASRPERLVRDRLPSKAELYRYYAKGPERYWLSYLDSDLRPTDISGRFRLQAVLDLLEADDQSKVLDVGCGSGIHLAHILRKWRYATGMGVDISNVHLQAARELAKSCGVVGRCSFVQADAELLPINERFDVILCTEVLEHLLEPAKLLARLRSLSHPRTCLVVSVPQIYMGGKAGTFELSIDDETHRYYHEQYDFKRISSLLLASGFRVQKCVGIYFTFPKFWPVVSYILRKVTKASPRADRQLNQLTRNVRALSLVMRCGPIPDK